MSKTPDTDTKQRTADPETSGEKITGGDPQLRAELAKQYQECEQAIRYMALDWDQYEDILFMQPAIEGSPEDAIAEGSLSTLVVERAARVVGQLPSGSVNALSLQDQGKSLLMNLLLNNYVYPNANEQYDFKTKLFLWDLYSNVYGTMAMVYDWVCRDDYVGPDCWLCPMRNFKPQQGRFNTAGMDYCFISTFTPIPSLQKLVDDKVAMWDTEAIQEILTEINQKAGIGQKASLPRARNDRLRENPMFRFRRRATWTNTGDVELITKYEAGKTGHWITYAPDYGNRIVRDIPNPHGSGKIPVVLKYALPTMASVMGLGDMERGWRAQAGVDAIVNLQRDKQALLTYPPMHVVPDGVTLPTIQLKPAAKMLMDNVNNVSTHEMGQSDNSAQMTFQLLKGAINNITGNSQTQTSQQSSGDATQGKTPQAIDAMQQSQSTRDALDTALLESASEELIEGFLQLINTQQEDPIELYMFGDEIRQIIKEGYDDIKDLVRFPGKKKGAQIEDASTAFIRIQPRKIKNEKGFRYKVDPGSTTAEDNEKQHQQLSDIVNDYVTNPQMYDALLARSGKTFDFGTAFKKLIITGGIPEWDEIIKDAPTDQAQQDGGQQQAQPQQQIAQPGQPQPVAAPQGVAAAPGGMPGGFNDADIQAAHAQIMGAGVGQ